jgi:CBS domain-containing protein
MTDIAYLLTPKREVVWVRAEGTLGEALERMRPNGFSAVPVLDDEGSYVGTLTEGDILWFLLGRSTFGPFEPLSAVPLRTLNRPVHINAKQDTLTRLAAQQNFVPVVDDREAFIGIVRRHSLIALLVPKRRAAS